jgi:holo-[acyl-carrier protein] synthase
MKALGTGWGDGVSWQDLEVVNLASGRPSLVLHGQAAEIAKSLGVRAISLSLTHTAKQAMALVILES